MKTVSDRLSTHRQILRTSSSQINVTNRKILLRNEQKSLKKIQTFVFSERNMTFRSFFINFLFC